MRSCIEINICERQAKMERILMKSFDSLELALPEDSFPVILSVHGQIWRPRVSSCHLQSQGIKGGGAGRRERWKGGSLRKDSKFRQGVGAAKYKGARSKDRLTLL